MASIVSKHIFNFLCKNEGWSDYVKVNRDLRQSVTVADQVLCDVLSDREKFVIVIEDEDSCDSILPAETLIIAKTSLRVCKHEKCVGCEDLHLCRYLVFGSCKFGSKCKNSHDMTSTHNYDLLRKRDLHGLRDGELFQLLLQNDPSLLPEVCSHYNKGIGEHGSCKFKASCSSLHLCQHFLQDTCKFGAACKRAHSFDENAKKILTGRGVCAENMHKLPTIYKNKLLITSPQKNPFKKKEQKAVPAVRERTPLPAVRERTPLPAVRERTRHKSNSSVSEADRNEICLYFLRNGCSFKDKCVRVHHHLPYKWQILQADGITWSDLPNEEEIEKAFCCPANNSSVIQMSTGYQMVDFISMKSRGSSVRRLSTASSVTKPPHFILTTEWLWYWRNDNEGWTEYGKDVSDISSKLALFSFEEDATGSVTSKDFENIYLADTDNEIPFTLDKHQYILKFKDMQQQNLEYKTVREVRRRPQFISAEDVKSKIKRGESADSSLSSTVEIPSHWDKESLPDFTYKTVPLQRSSEEYQKVASMFSRTMPQRIPSSIKRVQNLSLWRVFQWQKEQMSGRNGGKKVDERHLFHGTDESLIEAICEQNFDWRICGKHGSLYGEGSYFARDATYSDKYAKSKTSMTKKLFLARVLVGEFTKGNSTLVRPPPKSNGFYDSCVDNETNPAIFVIFEKYQIYPEYIIEYL